jgi:hypothetical protein
MATDAHGLHAREHKTVINDPALRSDPKAADTLGATLAHIQEHIDLGRQTDPALLMAIGEQPLGPPSQAPAPGGNPAPMPAPGPGPSQQEMPQMPSMPQNPLTGEQFNNQDGGGMV